MIGLSFAKVIMGAAVLAMTAGTAMAQGQRDNAPRHDQQYDKRGPNKSNDRHDNRGPNKPNDRHDDRYDNRGPNNSSGKHAFDSRSRNAIQNYYGGYYKAAKTCPRGFNFTRGVCRPKGWNKQRYVIGQPLPRSVVIRPMPTNLYRQLPPAPSGYGYKYVDGDVLLIANAGNRVLDAVVAINAAMNGSRR